MQTTITKKSFKACLLAGALLALPQLAMAQQIATEWTPMDDAGGGSSASAGAYGGGYGSDYGNGSGNSGGAADEQAAGSGQSGGNSSQGGSKSRVKISPFIEAQQVAQMDLLNGKDVLTYSTVAVGVDASVKTRRAEGQLNVRYERLIAYDDGVSNQDTVSGLARGTLHIARGLNFEAGGIATRAKVDGRGPSPTNLVGNPDNVTQVYSAYAGPTFNHQIGDLSVNASYRAGYTRVEAKSAGTLQPGQIPVASFDESTSQSAYASVGMQAGQMPVGWAVGVGYDREDMGQLDRKHEAKFARLDLTLPIHSGFAIVGGVGYEKIQVSERDALRDALGAPVVGAGGRYVTDPASPRLMAYESDGLIWDAGVSWRPSSRTAFEARYGNRYGGDTYAASLSYQASRNTAVNVSVYETITGFGNMLNDGLAALPTQFRASRNPLSGDLNSCAFSAGGGLCLNDALQSVSSAIFRARGVNAAISGKLAGWDAGIAGGFSERQYLTSALGAQANLNGIQDENYFATAYLGRDLGPASRFETNVYANYFDQGMAGSNDVMSMGANAAYYRQLIAGLSASAAFGVDSSRQIDFDKQLTGSALFGLRYSF